MTPELADKIRKYYESLQLSVEPIECFRNCEVCKKSVRPCSQCTDCKYRSNDTSRIKPKKNRYLDIGPDI